MADHHGGSSGGGPGAPDRSIRRVIGDGESNADRRLEGVSSEDLLALYRDMVLLRVFDERAVAYQ
ncbi:MAG: pyruvate dehydrogenase (acetyl-transferring) E1 component subunit alpha, partial [Actinomycetota bacterium]|nr:pyruvate dehydrogenase (acetyl-transferring) E1 component subunit alpha [Actinomycetota bacterium]